MVRSGIAARRWTLVLTGLCAASSLSSCDDYHDRGPTSIRPSHLLKLQGSGRGSGTVTAPDAMPELSCTISGGALSGVCAGGYPSNVTVQLNATPNAGSTFAGWTGTGCAGTDQCVVDMSQERTVTAAFASARP